MFGKIDTELHREIKRLRSEIENLRMSLEKTTDADEKKIKQLGAEVHKKDLQIEELKSKHSIELSALKATINQDTVTVSEYNILRSKLEAMKYERDMYKKMADTLQELPQLSKIYDAVAKLKLPSLDDLVRISDNIGGLTKLDLSNESYDRIERMFMIHMGGRRI